MPIIKSAKKAARQAEKRTEHNVEIKKAIKSALKAFKLNPTPETLAKAQSEYDKAVKKDLIKKNTAARRKARLYAMAKAAGVKLVATKKPITAKRTITTVAEKKATEKKPVAAAEKPATTRKVVAKKTESKAKAEKK